MKKAALMSGCYLLAGLVLFSAGCEEEDQEGYLKRELARARARLEETSRQLGEERKEHAEAMAAQQRAAEQRAGELRSQVRMERQRTEGGEENLAVAVAVALSSVLATVLIMGLLVRQVIARRVLARFLHWMTRRETR